MLTKIRALTGFSACSGAFLRVLRLVAAGGCGVTGVCDRCVASGDSAWSFECAREGVPGQASAAGCRLSGVGFYCRCGGPVFQLLVTGSAVIGSCAPVVSRGMRSSSPRVRLAQARS